MRVLLRLELEIWVRGGVAFRHSIFCFWAVYNITMLLSNILYIVIMLRGHMCDGARGRLNLGLCKRVSLKVTPFLVYACMCLVGRVFVLMDSFSSVLVRSIFWGAFVDSFSVCLSDTILISICALAWFRFQKFEKKCC